MFIFSAHDHTLLALTEALGYHLLELPSFASDLAFELWSDPVTSSNEYVIIRY